MTDKLFDSFIQQKLYHKESNVPAGLWDKIIAEKEKKRPLVIWWKNPRIFITVIAGLLLLATTTVYFGKYDDDKIALHKVSEIKNTNTQNSQSTQTTELKDLDKNASTAVVQKDLNKDNISKFSSTKKSIIVNNELQLEKQLTSSSIKNDVAKSFSKINSLPLNDLNNNIVTPLNNSKVESNDAQNSIDFSYLNSNKKSANGLMIGVEKFIEIPSNRVAKNEIVEAQFFTKSGKQMFTAMAAPPIINIRKIFGLDDCPSANGHVRNDWYIEGYGSADYTMKRVSNISTTADYLAKKDSAEKMQGGFTLGVRLSKSLSDNLLFKTGFQFNQMFEQFKLTVENERRITTTIITRTLMRTGLPDTTISDTTTLIQIGYRTQRNTNLYRSIELPILLSYEFGKPDSKFSFAFTAGAIVNLTTWNKGNTINELNQIVSINSKPPQASFYRNQIGLSAYLSASVIKQVNDKWAFFAEPYVRYSLGKNNLASGFVQQFDAIGINFGTRLKLNK
jgi:hypothetical protein